MNVQEFVDNVSDRIVDYLRDNKTQDMQEVRNIISIHLSHGLLSVLRNEEAELAAEQSKLIAEQRNGAVSPKRNAQLNAMILELAQKRKAIRKASAMAQENGELFVLKGFLKENAPELLEQFYGMTGKKDFQK